MERGYGETPQELTSNLEAGQKLNADQCFVISDLRSKYAGMQHEAKRQQSAAVSARDLVKCFPDS